MVVDSVSLFKNFLADYFKSVGISVDPNSIKTLNHQFGDVLIHCGISKWDSFLIRNIKEKSQFLEIDSTTFKQNQLIINLNRSTTIVQCFKELFSTNTLFPIDIGLKDKIVNLIYDTKCPVDDLTNFRINLLIQTMKNLAIAVDYDVKINESNTNGLYFTYKSNLPKDSGIDHKIALIGPVLNATAINKERKIGVAEYKQLKKVNLIRNVKHKDNFDEEISEILVDAILKFEFLRIKTYSPVMLHFSESESETSCTGSAVFVLYNYSRLNAIVHEFENRVNKKYYPPLPSIDQIDFSILRGQEEWILIFNYIVHFPLTVKNTVLHIREGKPSPHLMCNYLFAFARAISSYYRSTKILLEAKPYLFGVIYARIYLIKAIQRILSAGLELLNIQPVPAL